MQNKAKASFLVFFLMVFISQAAYAEDFPGIRAMGMGGALRSAATGNSALLLNPAGMSLINSYVIAAEYGYGLRRNGHVAHVSVVDSITSKNIAAGLYYNFFSARPEVFSPGIEDSLRLGKQGHQAGLALSVPFGSHFILGANARYQYFKTTAKIRDAETGEHSDFTADSVNTVGLDIGAVVRLSQNFNFSIVGVNLIPTSSMEAPLQLNTGLAFSYGKHFLAAFDVCLDFDVPERKKMVNVRGGVEGFLGDIIVIRAGSLYKSYWDSAHVTAGLGYVNPKIAIDLGFSQQVKAGVETQLGLSLRMFLN